MHDLIVIGAGPAGLLTAKRCAEAGLDVLVVEEHEAIGEPTHCTGVISLETDEVAKISPEIVLSRLTRARLFAPLGERCEIVWDADNAEQIVTIDRREFDRGLATTAVAAGVTVQTGCRVQRITTDERSIEVSSACRAIRGRACVLACGVSYGLQRQLGFGLPARLIHTAQVEVDAESSGAVELHFGRNVAPGGFLWQVPVVRDGRPRNKIGVLASGDARTMVLRFLERPDVLARLRGEPGAPTRRLLPLSPISRTFADRLLVVGDAGGFTKPTTGGGIFYSLLTASLAADTLIDAFHVGRLDGAFLESYERRWQDRLGGELRVSRWLRDFLVQVSDEEIGILVRALATGDAQAVIRRTAHFNWHRPMILSLVRQPGVMAVFARALLR